MRKVTFLCLKSLKNEVKVGDMKKSNLEELKISIITCSIREEQEYSRCNCFHLFYLALLKKLHANCWYFCHLSLIQTIIRIKLLSNV